MSSQFSSQVVSRYLAPVVRAFVRFCLRHSVSYQQLDELIRKEFVCGAQQVLREKGIRSSVSKLHAISGIRRKEISRIIAEQESAPADKPKEGRVSTGVKVIWTWASSDEYLTSQGMPRILSEPEFYALVRSVSTDIGPGALLSSFLAQGVVKRTKRGIRPVLASYQQTQDLQEAFKFVGADIEDLLVAVEENLQGIHAVPNVQATTEYWNIPLQHAEEVRTVLMRESENIHRRLRRYLGGITKESESGEKLTRVSFLSFSRVQERTEEQI